MIKKSDIAGSESYTEQAKADAQIQAELAGATGSQEDAYEVKGFTDSTWSTMKSHAWPLDVLGDGSQVRIKSMRVQNGSDIAGSESYTEQAKADAQIQAELAGATGGEEDANEVLGFTDTMRKTMKSHAWQLDVLGDGSQVRIKSMRVQNGSDIAGSESYTEQAKADALVQAELAGATGSQEDAYEVKGFSDSTWSTMKSRAWQLDVLGDGSQVRIKSMRVQNGSDIAGSESYTEQAKADALVQAELAGATGSQEDAYEVKGFTDS